MHTSERKPVDPNAKYETEDFALPAIRKGVFIFFVFALLHYPAVWLIAKANYWIMGTDRDISIHFSTADGQQIMAGGEENRRLPKAPAPLLQDNVTATADMRNLLIEERQKLNAEGVDAKTGVTKMPIDKAIEMEAARGGN